MSDRGTSRTTTFLLMGLMTICISGMFISCEANDRLSILVQASTDAERALEQVLRNFDEGQAEQTLVAIERLHKNHTKDLIRISSTHFLRGDYVVACLTKLLNDVSREQLRLLVGEVHVSSPLFNEKDFIGSSNVATQHLAQADELWRNGDIATTRRLWKLLADPLEDREVKADAKWSLQLPHSDLSREVLKRLMLSDLIVGNLRSADRHRSRLAALRSGDDTVDQEINATLRHFEEQRAKFHHDASMFYRPDEVDSGSENTARIDLIRNDSVTPVSTSSDLLLDVNARVVDGTLLVQDTHGLRALDPLTGRSRWPASDADMGFLFEAEQSSFSSGIRQRNLWIAQKTDDTLHAFDLNAQGLLVFKFPNDRKVKVKEHLITAMIALDENRFIVSQYQTRNQQLQLTSIDSHSAQQKWITHIGTLLTSGAANSNRDQLAIGVHEIFCNINGEAVACVESETGELRWVRGLETQARTNKNRPCKIQYHNEQVLALSEGFLTALNPNTGRILWKTHLPTNVDQLLGVTDVTVVVSGNQLWGVDFDTGEIRWRVGTDTPSSYGYGRGLVMGSTILWPTREELWSVDAHTGRILQRDFLKALTGEGGGSLMLHRDQLFVTYDESLRTIHVKTKPQSERNGTSYR